MEEYLEKKLEKITPLERRFSEELSKELGEWTTIDATAHYLKKHRNTIYNRVKEGSVISRKVGNKILIYTRSIVFLLESE